MVSSLVWQVNVPLTDQVIVRLFPLPIGLPVLREDWWLHLVYHM